MGRRVVNDEQESTERRSPPAVLIQLAIPVIVATIPIIGGAWINTWAGHKHLVSRVDDIQKHVHTLTAHNEKLLERLHQCLERTSRLESTIEFLKGDN